ncbi:MAG TPA: DUF2157 domain-containing protein [Acidobacteriaceae bacterium]|nr:DUF2157 domain-containing protein [Acidobacteriaceae bacterium]
MNTLATNRIACSTTCQMDNAERFITRWQKAGLLNGSTASAIREYEVKQAKLQGRHWQVLLALILGSILLGAGVLLFVAAHWEKISPVIRMLLVLSMLTFFHGLGWLIRGRFSGLATAMHAVGTVSAGAAIALVGQIFNMQEHWASAVLLWALCAVAGWILLRDQVQQTLALFLVPAWVVSEWIERTITYCSAEIYIARIVAAIGVVYLAVFLRSRKQAIFDIFFGVGAILLPLSIAILSTGWETAGKAQQWGFLPLSYRLAALGTILFIGCIGVLIEKLTLIPTCAVISVSYILPWAQKTVTKGFGKYTWSLTEPNLLAYVVLALASVAFVWWGVRISAKALVNYGVAAFAMTVIWFYFSNVMDKLGQSLGLIFLGVLFLAGGWMLDRARRKLLRIMVGGAA